MLGFVIRQLRYRPGRGAGLGAGILAAAAGFCLLTSSVDTEQANVHATVDANLWPPYDILVRPAGTAASPTPEGVVASGLVPDTYLSGIYGGITESQYSQISRLTGVGVAAPVAVLGYVLQVEEIPVDVTKYVSGGGDHLLRLSVTRSTDSGATVFPTSDESYLLVTGKDVTSVLKPQSATDGLPGGTVSSGGPGIGGQTVCLGGLSDTQDLEIQYQVSSCFGRGSGPVQAYLVWSIPMLVAGIDPVAENRLDGLGSAIVGGRYLGAGEGATLTESGAYASVPVLADTTLNAADDATVRIESVDPVPVLSHAGSIGQDALDAEVDGEPAAVLGAVKVSEQDAYDRLLLPSAELHTVFGYWTAGQASVASGAGGAVTVKTAAQAPADVWDSRFEGDTGTVIPPIDVQDTAFRGLTEYVPGATAANTVVGLDVVGTFDPSRVRGSRSDGSTQAALDIYAPATASGADAASRAALGGRPLEPNSNIAGYLQQPPTLLTTLGALSEFGPQNFPGADDSAPISVIRVKVSGLTGSDRQKLNRVAEVAYEIHKATGLSTDVMAGSSAQNVDVSLPAGKYGRPALSLVQAWTGEGVGIIVLDAVDRMSLLLFLVVLLATALFLANGVNAAVRARRREIGVLRALGWSGWAVFRSILGEVAVLGAIAGVLGTGLSSALVAALSLKVPWDRVALVTPVAVALAVGVGWLPAWRAARGRPTDVIAGSAAKARRAPGVHGVPGMILASLLRAPWRAATGAAALGISVVTLSILLSLNARFGAQIGDSALSGLVDLQARSVDYLSAAFAVLIGAASVADTVYLGMRERAAEFAMLSAHGWRRTHVARVALGEALAIGVIGAGFGALAAVALGGEWRASVTAAAAGILIVLLAAVLILVIGRARPAASILAEED